MQYILIDVADLFGVTFIEQDQVKTCLASHRSHADEILWHIFLKPGEQEMFKGMHGCCREIFRIRSIDAQVD